MLDPEHGESTDRGIPCNLMSFYGSDSRQLLSKCALSSSSRGIVHDWEVSIKTAESSDMWNKILE